MQVVEIAKSDNGKICESEIVLAFPGQAEPQVVHQCAREHGAVANGDGPAGGFNYVSRWIAWKLRRLIGGVPLVVPTDKPAVCARMIQVVVDVRDRCVQAGR